MADAVVVAVGKAVTAQLAAATLSQTIDPQYSDAQSAARRLEDDDLEQAGRLLVDVVPVQVRQKVELASRGTLQYTVPVHIAVRFKFGANKQDGDSGEIKQDEIDKLKLLVQDIFELCSFRQRLTISNRESGRALEILVCPLNRHLIQMRQLPGSSRSSSTLTRPSAAKRPCSASSLPSSTRLSGSPRPCRRRRFAISRTRPHRSAGTRSVRSRSRPTPPSLARLRIPAASGCPTRSASWSVIGDHRRDFQRGRAHRAGA